MSHDFRQGQIVDNRSNWLTIAILDKEHTLILRNTKTPRSYPVGTIAPYMLTKPNYKVVKKDISTIKKVFAYLPAVQDHIGKKETKKFLIALILRMKELTNENQDAESVCGPPF